MPTAETGHYKDSVLDQLARRANVAEFVSFGPDMKQRHAWIRGYAENYQFSSPLAAIAALLERASEHSVNIRSFDPINPKSREFIYGKRDASEVLTAVGRLGQQGLYTIVNETIDVDDGGVSGVAYGDVIEFAPGDTPRCVEKPGTASLSRRLALELFRVVYGFSPVFPDQWEVRVEFSLHPLRRGYRFDHTIIWEVEDVGSPPVEATMSWPNRFSRWIGDKAFGLLIADLVGLKVPRTLAVCRRVAPFVFGVDTGLSEPWIRTCPIEQAPGKFTTKRGWQDPFQLLEREDPTGEMISSVLCQQGVDSRFAGALIPQVDGDPLVEGVSGYGDDFMIGRRAPEELPKVVLHDVLAVYRQTFERLGPVRFEWVHDGDTVWIVQLHKGSTATSGRTIYPGESERYNHFDVSNGIDALRVLIENLRGTSEGIVLIGHVGLTSHFGDLLRRARIPSRIERPG